MPRILTALLLCILPLALWSADDTADIVAPVTAATASAPWWAGLVMTLVSVVLLPFLKQWLSAQSAAANEQAKLHQIDASKSLIEQKGLIMERLKAYLWGTAAAIVEKRAPDLCRRIIERRLVTADQVRDELRAWGLDLKDQAIYYFKTQGVDLVATFGHAAIDDLIERAANAVSPFPGKETAVALLKDGIAPLLLDKGVEYMKQRALAPTAIGITADGIAHPITNPDGTPVLLANG